MLRSASHAVLFSFVSLQPEVSKNNARVIFSRLATTSPVRTSSQLDGVKGSVRALLKFVHPDLFHGVPQAAEVNQRSLQNLNAVIGALTKNPHRQKGEKLIINRIPDRLKLEFLVQKDGRTDLVQIESIRVLNSAYIAPLTLIRVIDGSVRELLRKAGGSLMADALPTDESTDETVEIDLMKTYSTIKPAVLKQAVMDDLKTHAVPETSGITSSYILRRREREKSLAYDQDLDDFEVSIGITNLEYCLHDLEYSRWEQYPVIVGREFGCEDPEGHLTIPYDFRIPEFKRFLSVAIPSLQAYYAELDMEQEKLFRLTDDLQQSLGFEQLQFDVSSNMLEGVTERLLKVRSVQPGCLEGLRLQVSEEGLFPDMFDGVLRFPPNVDVNDLIDLASDYRDDLIAAAATIDSVNELKENISMRVEFLDVDTSDLHPIEQTETLTRILANISIFMPVDWAEISLVITEPLPIPDDVPEDDLSLEDFGYHFSEDTMKISIPADWDPLDLSYWLKALSDKYDS